MSCKFSHLRFGDLVNIKVTGTSICGNCGTSTASLLDGQNMIYHGHVGDIDLFNLVNPFQCLECGTWMYGYGEQCGGLSVTEEFETLMQDSYIKALPAV